MAIIRKLVAQDDNDDNQWLKVDHDSRYIVNDVDDWQFLFGPNSELTNSIPVVKIAARFNDLTFNNIQFTAYLYDQKNNGIFNAASCDFTIYKVSTPDWTEIQILTISASQLSNSYYYSNTLLSDLGLDFQGGDTIMIEVKITRLGINYRDRIYVNHLGIFDNVIRLKNEVDFLSITKKDL